MNKTLPPSNDAAILTRTSSGHGATETSATSSTLDAGADDEPGIAGLAATSHSETQPSEPILGTTPAESPQSLVSPVISRDFAAAVASDDVEKRQASSGAPPNPRLRALKKLARSASEPTPPARSDADLEKGGGGKLPGSEPIFTAGPGKPITFVGLLEPQKKLRPPPTWKTSIWNIATYSWLNVLLVFIPVSFACHFAHVSATATFCVSFAAIIPLAALLGFATEELALRVGNTLGGLLNATLGNTVELIIAILALVKGELRVVQSSMIGSILSNCLLVLGCCFFAGGIRFHEQIYTIRSAQLNSSLLGISAMCIVIPAAFHAAVNELGVTEATASEGDIIKLSRGVAFILLFVYASYLFFQLWTHSYLYSAKATVHRRSTLHRTRTHEDDDEPQPPVDSSVLRIPSWHSHSSTDSDSSSNSSSSSDDSDEEDSETPKLKVQVGIVMIIIVTVLTGLVAEWLVDSIDGLTASGNISKEFVALILLPLVGNAAEHVTAVTVSVKDKLDLSLAVAVGSSIQISLFVLPFLTILGWCIGQPLTLQFDVLETITLFVSIVIVNQAISDGKTNWLEGLVLMTVYLIIAVVFFFYPGAGTGEA